MVQIVKDYGRPLDWNVGSLFAHDAFLWDLVDVIRDLGYENPIKYVFGSIPCLFQGGRIAPRTAELKDALKILDEYNKRNIGCRLTFSNSFIETKDLNDELCNTLMKHLDDMGKDSMNGVIISSDILADYVREHYPNLQIIASQVKPSVEVGLGDDKDTVEYYNNLFDRYDILVVNPMKAINSVFLGELRNHDRVEFIANHRCMPNCPFAKFHYETQCKMGMELLKENPDLEDYEVTLNKLREKCYKTKARYPLAGASMSQSDIENLSRKGFTQFKIEGRDIPGVSFVRDLGDYVFNNYLFSRVAAAILRGEV